MSATTTNTANTTAATTAITTTATITSIAIVKEHPLKTKHLPY